MEAQLRLISAQQRGTGAPAAQSGGTSSRPRRRAKRAGSHARWALDAQTRQRGLAGVAKARQALDASRGETEGATGHRRAS